MITFKKDTELFIVDRYDEATDTIAESHDEVFKAGEPVDADIIGPVENGNPYVNLQFGDGGVSYSVLRECFDVLPVLPAL